MRVRQRDHPTAHERAAPPCARRRHRARARQHAPRARRRPGRQRAAPSVTDTITTNEDSPAAGNVLANDTNGGQGPLVVTSFTALSPAIGTLTIDADGNYVFTPAANWNGSTSTTYNVANNKHTRPGTINITVLPVNDAPTANDDTVTATEDAASDVTAGLLANDTDPDGDTLAVTAATNATGGTVGLAAGVVTFTPAADECGAGEGSFDYTVGDGTAAPTRRTPRST